jgi:hypothetical protein
MRPVSLVAAFVVVLVILIGTMLWALLGERR